MNEFFDEVECAELRFSELGFNPATDYNNFLISEWQKELESVQK
jgi:hypothetical protein